MQILVVDDLIPAPDQDAGSARMFMILKSLVKLGKVVFISLAGVPRPQYEELLKNEGVEVQPWQVYGQLLKQRRFDVAVLSRPDVAAAVLAITKKALPQCKVVFDTVDIAFLRLQREFEITGKETAARSARKFKKLEKQLAQTADQVWCATAEDARTLAQEVPTASFEVIPTIHPLQDRGEEFTQRCGLVFIGGFLHRPNEDAVRFFMREVFPLIQSEIADVEISIVGANPPDNILAYQSANVRVSGYVPDIEPLFTSCRVFVAPLRFGAGMKGKIGQALSYGVPVVTTSIGAEGIGLTNGHDAMIADDPAEFARAVVTVYQNAEVWQRLSDNGYKRVADNFAPEVVEKTIHQTIERLVGDISSR